MRNNFSTLYSLMLIVGDFIALLSAFVIAYIFRAKIDTRPLATTIGGRDFINVFLLLVPIIITIFAFLQLYSKHVYERRVSEFGRLLVGSFIGILALIGYDFLSDRVIFPARLIALYGFVLGFVLLVIERSVIRAIRRWLFGFGIGVNRVILVGSGPIAKDVAEHIENTKDTGQQIIGVLGHSNESFKKLHDVPVSTSISLIEKLRPDTILQTGDFDNTSLTQEVISIAQQKHIDYKFVPEQTSLYGGNTQVELYQQIPVINVTPTALVGWGQVVKRIFDIIMSLCGLILTSPILLLSAIAIKITDPKGPVIFSQKRLTRFDQEVTIYKLRSMKHKYSGQDPVAVFKELERNDLVEEFEANRGKVVDDPRVTKVGKFLRNLSIDELPQLWNVLKGDLSIVGPRAILGHQLNEHREIRPLMLSVKTGITGLAQVSGRDDISFDERLRLDLYYVRNWSFWLDMSIILKTVYVMITGKGFRS